MICSKRAKGYNKKICRFYRVEYKRVYNISGIGKNETRKAGVVPA